MKKDKRFHISSTELRINLTKLKSDVKKAYKTMAKIIPEAVKNSEIKKFGQASHVILPRQYAGKKATVIIRKKL